jgi:hypothetical protein
MAVLPRIVFSANIRVLGGRFTTAQSKRSCGLPPELVSMSIMMRTTETVPAGGVVQANGGEVASNVTILAALGAYFVGSHP